MYAILSLVIVFGAVIGGYMMHHGDLAVLIQPNEFVIIGGAGIGSFFVGNPWPTAKKCIKSVKLMLKPGTPYSKAAYLELLLFMTSLFKFIRSKGMLAIESHIENPEASDLFTKFPGVLHDHHAITFICDYIRLMTMGIDNPYQLDDMMTTELDSVHEEEAGIATSIVTLGDAFPALGIVAAVLGVITTMGSISEPPEILGGLIGAALVGTFIGVLLSYGMVGPMGHYLSKYFAERSRFVNCIKVGLLAHVQGNAPAISVEFARKTIPEYVMPTFKEVEEAASAG